MKKLILGFILAVLFSVNLYSEFGGEGRFGSVSNYLKRVNTNIVPSVDSTFDLGSNSNRWGNLYVDNITGTSVTHDQIIVSTITAADASGIRVENSSNELIWQFENSRDVEIYGGMLKTGSTTYGNQNNTIINLGDTSIAGTSGQNYSNITISGGLSNTASGFETVIAGGSSNIASGQNSVVGGGVQNESTALYSTIGGGFNNEATGSYDTVAGGDTNIASGGDGFIGGGDTNNLSGLQGVLCGGSLNDVTADRGIVLGGRNNDVNATYGCITSGQNNINNAAYSHIAGQYMGLTANATNSWVWGYDSSSTKYSTTPDAFLIFPTGGEFGDCKVGVNISAPTYGLDVENSNGVRLAIDSGSNNLIVSTNGFVGVNREDPLYQIHISSNHASELAVGLLLDNESGGTDSGTGVRFRSISAVGNVRCKAGIFFERTSAGGLGDLHFAVEGTSDDSNADFTDAKLTIDSNGNIGINDTTPSCQLEVNGIIKSTGLIINAGQEIDEFSTDGTLAGNSDTAIPTEKAVKTYVDDTTSLSVPIQYFADQLETPVNSSWTVNALANLQADSNSAAFLVRAFDDTTEEGVGFSIYVPVASSSMTITFVSRAETAPAGARTVGLKLYERGIPGAVDAWSAGTALTDIDITTNENWVYDTQEDSIADWGLTAGQIHQFELTRVDPSGGTELSGDWVLYLVMIDFH